MNKKFSTLLIGFAISIVGISAQCPSDVTVLAPKANDGDYVYLRKATSPSTFTVSTDAYFAVTKGASADSLYVITTADQLTVAKDSAIWQVAITPDGKYFSFKNRATGSNLSIPILDDAGKAMTTASTFGWNYNATNDASKLINTYETVNYALGVSGSTSVVGSVLANNDADAALVYPSTIPWVKVSSTELNVMYNGYFRLFDNSATSQTEQADSSHFSIESNFTAIRFSADDSTKIGRAHV